MGEMRENEGMIRDKIYENGSEEGLSLREIFEQRKGLVLSFENSGFNTNEGSKISSEAFDRNMRSIKTCFKTKAI